jgi:thymidylate synthase (FAD)
MKIVQQSAQLLWITPNPVEAIERAARTCYKSEDKITPTSAAKMIAMLAGRGHDAMIEHACASVKVVTDRGISHEIVRHRIASFAQESTRYVNYNAGKHGGEISVVAPLDLTPLQFSQWEASCLHAERTYQDLIHSGAPPEVARDVLPTCTKTELVITCNLREWRHFFRLRMIGATGKPHPKIKQLATMIFTHIEPQAQAVFVDLKPVL